VLRQRDTYFQTARGRLKLREQEGATPHLIAYERPDRTDSRESRYRIIEVEQADVLKDALADALGVKVVVAKERRLFLWNGVRIHLDQVDGLGSFIEFEAIASTDSDLSQEEAQVKALRQAFGASDDDLIGASYSDLALADAAASRRFA
jgi:predicted adenylyl cyclase CyaB